MVSTSSSSSSSSSFSSFDSGLTAKSTVKFVCSYGGTILPRYPDGKLRYVGGETRVLAVDRSLPFSELQLKLEELSGYRFCKLRCQLPPKDLDDALISVSSDDDLANLYEEFDVGTGSSCKIRAFLFPLREKPPRPPVRPPTATGHQRCCCCIHQPQRAAAVYQRPHGYHQQQQQQHQMYLVHHHGVDHRH